MYFATAKTLVFTSLLATLCSASWVPRQAMSSSPSSIGSSSSSSRISPSSASSSSSTASAAAVSGAATATGASPENPFPTNVGYLGTQVNGTAPFLAVTDRINGTLKDSAYENRFNATDDESGDFNLFEYLGNTSPYFSSPIFADFQEQNAVLPENHTISQVHILHRHGARYPTSYATEGAPYFGAVIANVSNLTHPNSNFSASGPLEFLNTWSYKLGAELLVPVGSAQLFNSGVHHYLRYGQLYNSTTQAHKPVIRTTSQSRMLNSARYWILGFFGYDGFNDVDLEVIIESEGFNNTLASYETCNNSDTLTVGDTYLVPTWNAIYLPNITQRLSTYVSGLNLTDDMTFGMLSLCAYETAALGYSQFCSLFSSEEWRSFEYSLDLEFSGDYGIMNPTGKAQGIGWVSEFLDRLTNSTFNASRITTENSTLDSSSTTFPLDQSLYADFTHDDIIVSVLTALNYTQVIGEQLDPTNPDPNRTFVLSHITPFAARLVFEIVESTGSNSTKYVRTLLNEAVVPYSSAQGCPEGEALCPLEDFVNFQRAHAYQDANFVKACFGTNGTDFNITGPVTNGTVY